MTAKRDRPSSNEEESEFVKRINAFAESGTLPAPPPVVVVVVPVKLRSISLAARVKRPTQPVFVRDASIPETSAYARQVIDMYNAEMAAYHKEMREYPEKLRLGKIAILETLEKEGVGREGRADVMLRYECDLKGISNTGVRLLLLDRLRKHDAGKAVMTTALKGKEKIDGTTVKSALVTHKTASLAPSAQRDGILCLNHDIWRYKILPWVVEGLVGKGDLWSAGPEVLFAVARTCKYLRDDVLYVLRGLAAKKFGCHYNAGVTPLAYSCYLFYYGGYWARHRREIDYENPTVRMTRMCKALRLPYNPCAKYLQETYRGTNPDRPIHPGPNMLYWYMSKDHSEEAVIGTIVYAIHKWGSVEGALREREKIAERAAMKKVEAATVFEKALDRIVAANKTLTEKFGFPPLLAEVAPTSIDGVHSSGSNGLSVTSAGRVLLHEMDHDSWDKKLRGHVYRMQPVTLKPIINEFERCLSRGNNLCKCLTWVEEAVVKCGRYNRHSNFGHDSSMHTFYEYMVTVFGPHALGRKLSPQPFKFYGASHGIAITTPRAIPDETVQQFVHWTISVPAVVHLKNALLTIPVHFKSWAARGPVTEESYADYLFFIWEDWSFPPHTFSCARGTLTNGEAYQQIVESRSVFRLQPNNLLNMDGWTINHETRQVCKPAHLISEKPPPSLSAPHMGVFLIIP